MTGTRADRATALRAHGFSASEVETWLVVEDEIARRVKADRDAPKVAPAALDFGDWSG